MQWGRQGLPDYQVLQAPVELWVLQAQRVRKAQPERPVQQARQVRLEQRERKAQLEPPEPRVQLVRMGHKDSSD